MLQCRVFVVIRNGMKSVFMCECDLYGRYICYKNMVYICNVCCVHIIRPDKGHPITFIANNNYFTNCHTQPGARLPVSKG